MHAGCTSALQLRLQSLGSFSVSLKLPTVQAPKPYSCAQVPKTDMFPTSSAAHSPQFCTLYHLLFLFVYCKGLLQGTYGHLSPQPVRDRHF